MNDDTYIIVPTIRNLSFLDSWKDEFKNCTGIILEDHKDKEIDTPKKFFKKVYHYTWSDIDKDLGKKSWIIPRKSSAIRSYGFLKAYQMGAKTLITLDDDCYPYYKNFVKEHVSNLNMKVPRRWFPTYPYPPFWFTRGFPYSNNREDIPVVVSHGLWTKNLDLDAPTHLFHLNSEANHNLDFKFYIPRNYYFPLCIMNVAFKREVTPLFYLLLMGYNSRMEYHGFERFDDIWAGILIKKVLDHLNLAVISGSPAVTHNKASNAFDNLQKEARGIKYNEFFWQLVDEVELKSSSLTLAYKELVTKIKFPKEDYFDNLRKAVFEWLELFE